MTKDSVLTILRNEHNYISGEKISTLLGVSRAAVNAAVKALRAEGYDILSSTNKGYLLSAVPNSLTPGELAPWLDAKRMETVLCADCVDSTNDRLRDMALAGAPAGQVVIANQQLKGRGRRGREFASPRDEGIYLSMLLRPDCLSADTVPITAWTAVAVSNAIETICGVRPGIKWVNDLVMNRRKVCGILTELSVESESGYVQYVILGLGLNVNQKSFPRELRDVATSLALEGNQEFSRPRLAAQIIRELDAMAAAWPRERQRFLDAYRRDNITTGQNITLLRRGKEAPATALSIGDDFSLHVRYEDGTTERLTSGEVSIRGLYGRE